MSKLVGRWSAWNIEEDRCADRDGARVAANVVVTEDQDHFGPFLAWLSPDPTEASSKLAEMRRRLAWFFQRHGQSGDAEDLAHDVLLIMAKKCTSALQPSYEAPEQLMVGIARNLIKRRLTQPHLEPLESKAGKPLVFPRPELADSDETRCLDLALADLTEEERALLTDYFDSDEWERAGLARQRGLGASALRVRVHRVKRVLLKKIDKCLQRVGQR